MAGASLALALWLLLLPGLAGAQAGDAGRSEARAHAERGSQLFEAGKYREAIAWFRKAYSSRPHFLVQCNIARCHELLGELALSAQHYRRCLDEGAATSAQAEPVREALAQVEQKLAGEKQAPEEEQPALREPAIQPERSTVREPRPWWAGVGLGAAIRLMDTPSQLKLRAAAGYHLGRVESGPSLGLDLQVSLAGSFTSIEIGPLFSWDFPVAPAQGLVLGPSLGLGLAHLTAVCVVGGRCGAGGSGLSLQLGVEAKLMLAGRGLLIFRPIGIDLIAVKGEEWETGLRYDLMMGGGLMF